MIDRERQSEAGPLAAQKLRNAARRDADRLGEVDLALRLLVAREIGGERSHDPGFSTTSTALQEGFLAQLPSVLNLAC